MDSTPTGTWKHSRSAGLCFQGHHCTSSEGRTHRACFVSLLSTWNPQCTLRLALEQALLVPRFIPSWPESLRWALSYPEFPSGSVGPSVFSFPVSLCGRVGARRHVSVSHFPRKEAILEACLAGGYRSPATVPCALQHREQSHSHCSEKPLPSFRRDRAFLLSVPQPLPCLQRVCDLPEVLKAVSLCI